MAAFLDAVRRAIESSVSQTSAPILVHCSAGVGRTGTFISLFNLVDEAKAEGVFDILQTVQRLRQQRVKMVQTKEQLGYIHDVVEICCSKAMDPIVSHPNRKMSKMSKKTLRDMENHLRRLVQDSPEPAKDESSKNARSKTRFFDNVNYPPDFSRVYVETFLPPEGENFVYAVFADSYWRNRGVICGQSPIANSVAEFLAVVFEQKIERIVVLNQFNDKEGAPRYWLKRRAGGDGGAGGGGGGGGGGGEPNVFSQPPFAVERISSGKDKEKSKENRKMGRWKETTLRITKDDKKSGTGELKSVCYLI